jgi:hypothetical protein
MMVDATAKKRTLIEILILFSISALLYLPLANRFGYYNDDWYSMYAARVAGPQIFHQIYSLDRPGRAYVMIPLYVLFGGNPFYYSLSAYLFRVLGALALLWLLRMLWPENRRETFLSALLFLVYPGFLSQPIAIDFQSHLVGILLAFLSIGLTVKSLSASSLYPRLALWLGSVLTGWFYLSQMEYYIGFEAVRFFVIALLIRRRNAEFGQAIIPVFRAWLPSAVIPVGFLTWRFLLFHSERAATDIGAQLGKLAGGPFHTILTWSVYFVQDIANVIVLAWGVPLYQLAFGLRLRDSLIAFALAVLVLLVFYLGWYRPGEDGQEAEGDPPVFRREGVWFGLGWVVAGLLPVILANRHVIYPDYSRYGLVSAAGAVIVLVAAWTRLGSRNLQLALLASLLASASLTHYANSVAYAEAANDIRSFWWQVSWRAPQFEQGTTLVAHYPNTGVREPSFVWGPANQIYYPVRLQPDSVQAGIYAILLDHDSVIHILNGDKPFWDRTIIVDTYPDYGHITVLTRPSEYSCVQVIDGAAPEYSRFEADEFLSVGSHSEIERILPSGPFQTPPGFLFGSEPPHSWCYYYEKASFARQEGEWMEVLRLGQEAAGKGYRPDDLIEWMPFLQAYAIAGELDQLSSASRVIQSDEYVAKQACRILQNTQGLTEEVRSLIDSKYCGMP